MIHGIVQIPGFEKSTPCCQLQLGVKNSTLGNPDFHICKNFLVGGIILYINDHLLLYSPFKGRGSYSKFFKRTSCCQQWLPAVNDEESSDSLNMGTIEYLYKII
jgi:hypothetical protein